MELEFDILGDPGKLMKYIIHSSERKIEKSYISSHKLPKLQSTNFWSHGILGVNLYHLPISSPAGKLDVSKSNASSQITYS
jgi:hypothetical protein